MDQHVSIARLEAVCPPDAKRPHHQDAYLVARFPEPQGDCHPGDKSWDDWQRKTDLMRRLVAKFRLTLRQGRLSGAPPVAADFLIPPVAEDRFGQMLHDELRPIVDAWLQTSTPNPRLNQTRYTRLRLLPRAG
jgi:hypothetical protein